MLYCLFALGVSKIGYCLTNGNYGNCNNPGYEIINSTNLLYSKLNNSDDFEIEVLNDEKSIFLLQISKFPSSSISFVGNNKSYIRFSFSSTITNRISLRFVDIIVEPISEDLDSVIIILYDFFEQNCQLVTYAEFDYFISCYYFHASPVFLSAFISIDVTYFEFDMTSKEKEPNHNITVFAQMRDVDPTGDSMIHGFSSNVSICFYPNLWVIRFEDSGFCVIIHLVGPHILRMDTINPNSNITINWSIRQAINHKTSLFLNYGAYLVFDPSDIVWTGSNQLHLFLEGKCDVELLSTLYPGSYLVAVTDSMGCSLTQSVTIGSDITPVFNNITESTMLPKTQVIIIDRVCRFFQN